MNLIQFKQVQGLENSFTNANALTTGVSGYLEGQIFTLMTGDSTFSGQKTFKDPTLFESAVTGQSSGNFQGGLWVGTYNVLTSNDTGNTFVELQGDQNITGIKKFQGGTGNTVFQGGLVKIIPWGTAGEPETALSITGKLFITGYDGNPMQVKGPGVPEGVDNGVQVKDGSVFSSSSGFMWDGSLLTVDGTVSGARFSGGNSWYSSTGVDAIYWSGSRVGIGVYEPLTQFAVGGEDCSVRISDTTTDNLESFDFTASSNQLKLSNVNSPFDYINCSGNQVAIGGTPTVPAIYSGRLHISGGDTQLTQGNFIIRPSGEGENKVFQTSGDRVLFDYDKMAATDPQHKGEVWLSGGAFLMVSSGAP